MRSSSSPRVKCSDELLLAGHMLQALDSGRISMHAIDYLDIAGWISAEFALMDTACLRALHHLVPASMQSIVENHLHRRREGAWTSDARTHAVADLVWHSLRAKLAK